ncbi:hypothetical protein ACPBEI_07065 [Latilactobacillus sakei]
MLIWLLLLVLIGLAGGLAWFIHRIRRQRAMRILQSSSQETVDEIVNIAYQRLLTAQPQFYTKQAMLTANSPTEVWGGNVMLFEYRVNVLRTDMSLKPITETLEQTLNEVADERRIASVNPKYPALVITDAWLLDQDYHFDVAFIVNRETIEYVKDMARVMD